MNMLFNMFNKKSQNNQRKHKKNDISIGITTFEARFSTYFVSILDQVKKFEENSEIIIAVNGEHNREFGEDYRKDILHYISQYSGVYPIVFPRFRGLSKLWNSIIIHATNDYILMLNDDLSITNQHFLEDIARALDHNGGRTFLINNSWSHFVINRNEIDELGYFDERLLGIGEEDGDMIWRYIDTYGIEVPSYKIRGIVNHAEATVRTYKPHNIRTHSGTKYSLFNREFMFNEKYAFDERGIKGIFGYPVRVKDPCFTQYPNERFYRKNKKLL